MPSILDHRIVALVIFLGSFIPAVLSKYRETFIKKRLATLESRIRDLKRQAIKLDTPSTFVECSRVKRELVGLEKDAERLKTQAEPKRAEKMLTRIPFMLKMMFFVSMAASVGYRTPFVQLPEAVVGPINRLVSSKKGLAGNITGSMWIFACERTAGVVAGAAVEVLGAVIDLVAGGPGPGAEVRIDQAPRWGKKRQVS